MTSTQNSTTAHDIFWLARYAHNKVAPLFAQVEAIEPSAHFSIDMHFSEGPGHYSRPHIAINCWWDRDGMFKMSSWLEDQAAVDRFAAHVEGSIANLEPLEAGASA